MNNPIKIHSLCICKTCGKEYGKTNFKYKNVDIWAACDCLPKGEMFFINLDEVVVKDNLAFCLVNKDGEYESWLSVPINKKEIDGNKM